LKVHQVAGGPDWVRKQEYSVTAKTEGERMPTLAELRPMLQTLLADRFQLKFQPETRDLAVYHLVVGK
jgi:uncharacterized protein (TIGR03435 family)